MIRPLIFVIFYVNALACALNTTSLLIVDDVNLVASINDCQQLQKTLDAARAWSLPWNLDLNPNKWAHTVKFVLRANGVSTDSPLGWYLCRTAALPISLHQSSLSHSSGSSRKIGPPFAPDCQNYPHA